jgi:hypothetical protein
MRIRTRNLFVIAVVVVIVAGLALAIYLRRRAAPEPARLLPESDAVVYVNFKLIRRLTNFGSKPVEPHEPEYERFVQETGFQFERDLDAVAFAVHAAKPGGVPDTRYSEVFEGHFDGQRASAYLRKIAASTEKYRDVEIFNIPVENRVVRVAILGVDTSAASNTEGPTVIHGIIDRYKQLALPFTGPPLIRDYYKKVPFASLVWAMAAVPQAPDDPRMARSLTLPGGFDIYVPPQSVLVASARTFTGNVNVKAELFTKGEEDARKFAEQTGTFLSIFKSIEGSMQPSGSDPDVKAVFESLKVEQEHDRAIVTATLPLGFFKKMLAEPPVELGAPKQEEQAPAVAPKQTPEPKKHQKKK